MMNKDNETKEHREKLAQIVRLANQVFGNPEKSRKWLNSPKRALDGRSPIEMLDSAEGVRRVEELLGRLDEGFFG
jgi:putative toxin-antitoxin system antitoxin component (TIGR02293 family)